MIFLFVACTSLPTSVTMKATVWDAPYGEGAVVPGARVAVGDAEGALWDAVTAGDNGAFEVEVPAGVAFFVTVEAEGHVPTAFSGTAGIADFAAPEGYPWVAPEAWIAALREDFAACPTVGDAGAIVTGEIVANAPNYPILTTGSARVFTPDGGELTACYLDDDGVSVAEGTQVGETGRYAIFGVPAGEIVVDVRYADGSGQDPVELYRFVAPDGGLVPLLPTLLDVG